jgi:hypothetical protein
MGGATGRVVSTTGRAGGKISVRVGSLTVELRLNDVAPASGPAAGLPAAASSSRARKGSGGGGSLTSAAKQLRALGSLDSSDDEDGAAPRGIAIQTSRNTVDVRGMRGDDAAAEVRSALLAAPSGWVLFVVHGVGTGRVRQQVWASLKGHPRVAKTEEAEASNGGCTLVYVR